MLGLLWLVIIPQRVNVFEVLLKATHVDAAHRTVEIEGVSQKSWNGIIGILCAE